MARAVASGPIREPDAPTTLALRSQQRRGSPWRSVYSEVGKLRQVILHRPGLELTRLSPTNVSELLFDDIPWAKRAREEHDAFAQELRDKGVKVHLFANLLAEVLEDPPRGRGSSTERSRRTRSARPWCVRCGNWRRSRRVSGWPSC